MINATKVNKIISGILEAPNESKTVEFKPSMPWPKNIKDLQKENKAQEIILSILAMSNIRDGGKVILGVEKRNDKDNIYESKGMKKEHLNSYDHDLIFEHIRNYGEPEPKVQISNEEWSGKNFIVFAVQSFKFAPVICKNPRNLTKLEHSALYIRTDKPESKKVTDPSEMREIVDLAVENEIDIFSSRMQRFFKVMSPTRVTKTKIDENKFKDELKDIK